jgi:hypothetical protein
VFILKERRGKIADKMLHCDTARKKRKEEIYMHVEDK